MEMKQRIGMLVVLCTVIGSMLYAGDIIWSDTFNFDDLALRSTCVGTLTITASASRNLSGTSSLNAVAWSPHNNYLVAGFTKTGGTGSELVVFEHQTLKIVGQHDYGAALGTDIHAVSWCTTTTDGTSLIAVGGNTTGTPNNEELQIFRFNGSSLKLMAATRTPYVTQYYACQWSPNGQYLAVGGDGATTTRFRIYHFDGSFLYLVDEYDFGATVRSLSWSPCGEFVALGGDSLFVRVIRFNGEVIQEVSSINVSNTVNVVAFRPDGRYLGYGTNDVANGAAGILSFTNATLAELTVPVLITYGGTDVFTFAWSMDGATFSFGGTIDGSLEALYEFYSFDGTTATDESMPIIYGNSVSSRVLASAWSHDCRFIAIGGTAPTNLNGISNSYLKLYTTGLNPTPALNEAIAKAPNGLSMITTTSGDHFWGIDACDLKFSSTEAAITAKRAEWVNARSQGSIRDGSIKYLLTRDFDDNIYALDKTGKAHVADSVVVGPTVRINWKILTETGADSPVLCKLLQSGNSLFGMTEHKQIYDYLDTPSGGWMFAGYLPHRTGQYVCNTTVCIRS